MSRPLPMIPDAELVPNPTSSPASADDAAGFGSLRTERGGLPLESMDVCARIDGLLARVVVRQTFVNGCDASLEAAYIFPLPDRGEVTGFRMTVGGREIVPEDLAIEPGEVVPRRLPDLFPGSPVRILGRYRGTATGSITIRGLDAAGTVRDERVAAEVRENPAIASAWARGQVRQLEDRYASHDGDLAILEKAIVAISLRFGVLCRFTVYVAVDRSQVANPGGQVHRVTQPVELPAGYAVMAAASPSLSRLLASPGIDAYMAPETMLSALPLAAPFAEEALQVSCFSALASVPDDDRVFKGEARTLAEFLADGIPIDASQAATLVAEIAEAAQRLRDEGPLRGDLAPERILIDVAMVRLVGIQPSIESLSRALLDRGTDTHRPSPDETRAEVHALGVILYRLLTGQEPSTTTTRARAGRARLIRPRQLDTTIPAEFESICLNALEGVPAARYSSEGEVAAALRGFLQSRAGSFWK